MSASPSAGGKSSSTSDIEQLFQTATPALVSGALQAVLFNPYDRALYVRVQTRRRRFLDRRNWERPFQGFGNAAAYRTIVGASYIFWQDSCRIWIPRVVPCLNERDAPTLNAISVGLIAGAVNGLALNNLQAVKFRMWSSPSSSGNFLSTARSMYQSGGVKVFFRGCVITMQRDSVFGVVYEGLRHSKWFRRAMSIIVEQGQALKDKAVAPIVAVTPLASTSSSRSNSKRNAELMTSHHCPEVFLANLFAALFATIISAPFNFVRSVAYGTPSHASCLPSSFIIRSLWTQARYAFVHGETFHRLAYSTHGHCAPRGRHYMAAWRVMNRRLNVGWGSIRVGLGMAIGQYVFALVQHAMKV